MLYAFGYFDFFSKQTGNIEYLWEHSVSCSIE